MTSYIYELHQVMASFDIYQITSDKTPVCFSMNIIYSIFEGVEKLA